MDAGCDTSMPDAPPLARLPVEIRQPAECTLAIIRVLPYLDRTGSGGPAP
jgi:hypothetical protein